MKLVRKIFLSKPFFALVGALIVGILIWFIGPLIGFGGVKPLDSVIKRAFMLALLPAIFGINAALQNYRLRQQNGAMADALAGSAAGASAKASAEAAAAAEGEVAELGKKL